MTRPGTLWEPDLALRTLIEMTSLAHLVSMTSTLPHFSEQTTANHLYCIKKLEKKE